MHKTPNDRGHQLECYSRLVLLLREPGFREHVTKYDFSQSLLQGQFPPLLARSFWYFLTLYHGPGILASFQNFRHSSYVGDSHSRVFYQRAALRKASHFIHLRRHLPCSSTRIQFCKVNPKTKASPGRKIEWYKPRLHQMDDQTLRSWFVRKLSQINRARLLEKWYLHFTIYTYSIWPRSIFSLEFGPPSTPGNAFDDYPRNIAKMKENKFHVLDRILPY